MMVKPAPLAAGDRVALVAPAGVCDPVRLATGVQLLRDWGLDPVTLAVDGRLRYMADSDQRRAAALTEAFSNNDYRAVMAVRGGFGCARLLDRFDTALVAANPIMLTGFSDLSLLLNRVVQEAGVACYHAPMVAADLPRLGEVARESFRRFLFGEDNWFAGQAEQCWRGGVAEGLLVGGCLSVLVTTLGTPAEIDTESRILFLEDVAEKPYRIDRMMTHLRQAGKLDRVAGLVLGPMTDCDDGQGPDVLRDIVLEALAGIDCPVAWGLQSGHGCDNGVLPFGCRVRLDADAPGLELLEPVLTPATRSG